MKTNDTTRTGLERTTMRRAATGDGEALRTLVAEHGQALFGQALRLLPTREEAEDALQDAMLHAMRYAYQYDERRSSLRTWLTRIVYTTCLRHIERRPVAQVVSLDGLPDVSETTLDEAFSTGNEERIAHLMQAMEQLTDEERTLLALRYEEERPLTEVASLFATTPDALYQRLHRIRKRLYHLIIQLEHEDHEL
ncbi:MAG: sigma-70 family RNA polymerase sigma factor [Bacteroidaceae bacterium]|nr:sigma-70 family RNA polymerase sigma factor [Bacteroidaceae bacterium]